MGCKGYQKQYSAYLAGELDREQRAAMERHLRACAACRAEVQSLRQTVSLLHTLAETPAEPPAAVRAALTQKLRSIRQPLSWRERLRLQWRAGGWAGQARSWGYGFAVSMLLFTAGAVGLDHWHAPGEPLAVGIGIGQREEAAPAPQTNNMPPQRPEASAAAPVTNSSAQGARIRCWVESGAAVGRQTTLYLFIAPDSDLNDVTVSLYPSASMTVGGKAVLQDDASYQLYHGPIVAGDSRTQWVPVELLPTSAGKHELRVVLQENGRVLTQDTVSLFVNQ